PERQPGGGRRRRGLPPAAGRGQARRERAALRPPHDRGRCQGVPRAREARPVIGGLLEAPPRRGTVLVVDDEEGVRASFRVLLEDECAVLEAEDGEQALEVLRRHEVDVLYLRSTLPRGVDAMVGRNVEMARIYQLIAQIAPTSATVLVTGESGTGKELVARAIHEQSPRARRPFVAVNVAALPEALVESELFGHEKGAFTGALAQKPGRFELAHGGTLFLDEIGSLRLDLQAKLLRALQERE